MIRGVCESLVGKCLRIRGTDNCPRGPVCGREPRMSSYRSGGFSLRLAKYFKGGTEGGRRARRKPRPVLPHDGVPVVIGRIDPANGPEVASRVECEVGGEGGGAKSQSRADAEEPGKASVFHVHFPWKMTIGVASEA